MTSSEKVSKFLSLVLRHQPERVGIALDEAGWVDVEVLLAAVNHQMPLSRDQLNSIVENNDKQRFAFSSDGKRIRANQGHSIDINLGYKPSTPPAVLYHGTATRFLDSIKQTGLQKMSRTHVHLSANEATAGQVGQRHGKLVILTIDAATMEQSGYLFYISDNGVWLTEEVPPRFIVFPED